MDERLERYAELVVGLGANVQPGQEVFIVPQVEHADVARALTRAAYKAGAAYVHVNYGDPHVRHAMIELGLEGRDWLAGDAMTVADIALYAYTHCAGEGGFSLDGYPAIGAWLSRCAAEPGHVLMDA